MRTCAKCHAQMPDEATECENCHADLNEWSTTAVALKKHINNPRVKYILLMVDDDCCPACRVAKGAYTKDNVPVLPVEGCSHPLGCRCFYQPFLEELYP